MKKITLTINLFFLLSFNILPQNCQYSWIPSAQFGLPHANKNIENNLNVAYYIKPGRADEKLNETYNMEFKNLWKYNKFTSKFNFSEHTRLNRESFNRNAGSFGLESLGAITSGSLYAFTDGANNTTAGIENDSSKNTNTDSVQFINYSSNNSASVKAVTLWQKDLKEIIPAPILAGKSNIFVAVNNGDVYCFDLVGNLQWQSKTGGTILSKPALADSVLVVGTVEGDLISLNAATGNIIQTIGLSEPVTSQLITFNAEYNGNPSSAVVAGTSKGSLFCYDVNSFEQIWENHSSQDSVSSEPLLINDRILYTCRDGNLYCVDARSGIINWKILINNPLDNQPVLCKPVTDGKSAFIASPDKNVSSIDLMLGRAVWQKNYDAFSSIQISDNKEEIFIKSQNDNFLIIFAKSGKLIKNIKIGFGNDFSPTNILKWNNNILFTAQDGKIYLIDKSYKWYPLLYLGTGGKLNIYPIKDNIFAASTSTGKIVVFKLEKRG